MSVYGTDRPKHLPSSITREQYDEYRRLHLAAIEALGIDPHLVVRDGIRSPNDGIVEVEFIVPADDWDGSHPIPSVVDEWRENEVRKGRITLRAGVAA